MSTRDLARIAVFLIGLYRLPDTSISLVTWIYLFVAGEFDWSLWYAVVATMLELGLIFSFVVTPGWWAGLVCRGDGNVPLPDLEQRPVAELLFALVGVILVASGVYDLANTFEANAFVFQIPGALLKIAIGLALFLGSSGVAQVWRSLRTAGHVK